MILNRFKKKRERKINQNQFLKETLKKQLNSISETLQMVSLYKNCDESISNVLFNQIGILLLCSEEIKKLL
ncbi:hypothetical protein DW863_03090 [Coprobacillus sp. AM37-9BH]|nr:hypothetical protein DW863_03090 [Coprobacillus sp. AM37-9BH]